MANRPDPTSTGWDDRLRGLAALLPLFNGPGSDPDTAINALNEAAYRLGWVLTDFDCPVCGNKELFKRPFVRPEGFAPDERVVVDFLAGSFFILRG